MATFPHIHSPAKHQTFFVFRFKVKTDRSDSNLDWNLLSVLATRRILLVQSAVCCRLNQLPVVVRSYFCQNQ
jgi:hypothetical protein